MKRVLQEIRPRLYVDEPGHAIRRFLFRLVQHPVFDNAIMTCIVVSTLAMALEHDGDTATYVPVHVQLRDKRTRMTRRGGARPRCTSLKVGTSSDVPSQRSQSNASVWLLICWQMAVGAFCVQ